MAVLATTAFAAEPSEVEKVQAALDAWLAARAPVEKVTGIAAYISFGATGPAIEAFAGKVGRDPDSGPLKELADAAYPSATSQLPVSKGYHYSNTNYVLAGVIAEKATGKSYRDLVHEMVIEPRGLTSTFYEASTYPEPVIKRLSTRLLRERGLRRIPTEMQRKLECADHRAGHAHLQHLLDAICRRRHL